MARERDEFEIEDASIGFAKQKGGGRACLVGLDNLPKFRPEKGKSYDIFLVPFLVSDAINAFHEDCRNASPGRWYYEQSFLAHSGVGVNNESHTCLARTFNAPCPVCEDIRRLAQSAHKLDKEHADGLKPKNRQLFFVWDLNARETGLQWWELAQWNFGRHLKEFIGGARKQDYDNYLRFYHPRNGYELRITATERAMGAKKEGDRGGTNTEFVVNGFYPLSAPIPDHILQHGIDLSKCVRRLSYSALKALYEGRVEDDGGGAASANGHGDRRDYPDRRDDRAAADRGRDGEPFGQRVYGPDQRVVSPERRVEDAPARRPAPRDDDEPPPRTRPAPARAVEPDEPPFSKGDQVTFDYKGNTFTGEVVRLDHDRKLAGVQVPDYERPHTVPFADMKLAADPEPAPRQRGREPDPEPDPEPVKRGAARPAAPSDWDDDPPPASRPAARTPPPAADDDDDGRSFRRRPAAAPAADPEPAPKARGRGKAADPAPEPEPAPKRGRAAAPADDDDPPARKRK
jgi:hypothetical protein